MAMLQDKIEINFSSQTLRRFIKNELGYTYKRARFIPPKSPDKETYEDKKRALKKYEELADIGKIDLYYFDESGFSINSNIPYAWSPKNETKLIKSFFAKRFNVLGFLSKQGNLKAYIEEGNIDSDVVIKIFDEFSLQITKPTVVVLDNASFHKSKKFKANIAKWSQRGLTIFYLPPYSPELNAIEILWKFMKYIWIDFSALCSYESLKIYIQKVIDEYGVSKVINFV
jgi:transposase